ncbi:MAG: hypothetical protein PUP90_27430 [Nostoc sp. S4]|nr:hypothetical protein [Nostoc sp. S4]
MPCSRVIVITVMLVSFILNVVSNNWTNETIVQVSIGLPILLVNTENIFVRSQTRSQINKDWLKQQILSCLKDAEVCQ